MRTVQKPSTCSELLHLLTILYDHFVILQTCSDPAKGEKLQRDSENYHLSDLTSNFLRPKGLKALVFARTRRHHSLLSAHLVHTLIKFVSLVMMLSYR